MSQKYSKMCQYCNEYKSLDHFYIEYNNQFHENCYKSCDDCFPFLLKKDYENKCNIEAVNKIKNHISGIIKNDIKPLRKYQNFDVFKFLPYDPEELKNHLENQFDFWMKWSNWGRYITGTWDDDNFLTWKWQIDHIKPRSNFQYLSMEDKNFKECWSLSNLRPLSAKQNLIDGVTRIRH